MHSNGTPAVFLNGRVYKIVDTIWEVGRWDNDHEILAQGRRDLAKAYLVV
jgi:hypothetical protein